MKRRLLSMLLCLVLLFSFSARAFADSAYDWDDDDDYDDDYDDDFDYDYCDDDYDYYCDDDDDYCEMISDVLARMDSVNATCSGGIQMQVNGVYRLVELFSIIAGRLSQSSEMTDDIQDVLDEWDRKNDAARSATEQVINGSYRCFDLLALIAWEMDKNDDFSDSISKAGDDFAIGNNSSQTADQLLTNAFYSCDDLLYIIAQENSGSDAKSDNVNGTYDFMLSTDRTLNSEASRQLNGANCMLSFLLHICQELDKTSSRDWANSGHDLYEESKDFCSGISDTNERIAAKLYHCVQMTALIATELA